MQNARYEVDPYNRLIVDDDGRDGDLHKFRQVLDGQFKVDGANNLSYHIKAPLDEDEGAPRQVRLDGEWSLTGNHELRLTLDNEARKTLGDEITLQGQILDAGKDSLIFAMTTKTDSGDETTYVLNLYGWWKADESNRLSFFIRREAGKYNILTFNCAWQINKSHQIIYQYEKSSLVDKKREVHILIFKGHWDIKKRARITYSLGGSSESAFDFQTSAGILKENYIEYEIGIALARNVDPFRRVITLFGRWNLKKDAGLFFEIEYGDGEISAIAFGADARLTDKGTVSFRLKESVDNGDLDMTVELSREILEGDGEAFLRALASKNEVSICAGMAWRW